MLRMRPRPEGFKRIRTKLEALQLTRGDLRGPVLRVMDSVHNRQVRQAFTSRGATVATGPWPAWSKRYADWRARNPRTGRRMMRLTDTLYRKATAPNHAGHIAEWRGRLRFAFGYIDDVGFWHQHAAKRRSVIDKTEPQRRDFVAAFVNFYRARIRQVLRHL